MIIPCCMVETGDQENVMFRALEVTVKLCGPVGAEEKRMLYIIAGWPSNMYSEHGASLLL